MHEHSIQARFGVALAILALGLASAAQAEDWWFGGSLALTSDYVYRGVSQTDEGPAIQGSVDFGHASGFYAGAWMSNVDFDEPGDGIDLELNLYAGWVFEFDNDTALDLQVVRYIYPGARRGFVIDYNEFIAAYSFLDYFTATFAYTNDWLNSGEDAFYYHFGAKLPLGVHELELRAGAGFNDVSSLAGSDYWDFQLGVGRSWGIFDIDLSYFDTAGFNSDVQAVLGPRAWANGRVVLSVSVEF